MWNQKYLDAGPHWSQVTERGHSLAMLSKFLILILFSAITAHAGTIAGGTITENFKTIDHADLSGSTGVWDIVNFKARAGAVANAQSTRPFTFGDGSDGELNSANGYTFDTDSHPNGYNFTRVNISGGTVTVQGSNPLIIRSLTTVTITPTISAQGGNGSNGSTAAGGTITGPSGGVAKASKVTGGVGGTAVAGIGGTDGGHSINHDASVDPGTAGTGSSVSGAAGGTAGSSVNGPGPAITDFDLAGFIAGSSGAGGGAHSAIPPDANQSSGGSGGAGGGLLRIIAVGDIQIGNSSAAGGNGGSGSTDASSCSGSGGGGNGGAVWFQTLGNLNANAPSVLKGTGGIGGGCVTAGPDGLDGLSRADAASVSGAMTADNSTTNSAANQSYTILSKAFDMNTLNASFDSNPQVTATAPAGGSTSVSYAGSVDGKSFSDFTSDITQLSNKSYRYLKFKVTINTHTAAAVSPAVSQIQISFKDAGLEVLDLDLSFGTGFCGSLQSSDKPPSNKMNGAFNLFFWISLWLLGLKLLRSRSDRVST